MRYVIAVTLALVFLMAAPAAAATITADAIDTLFLRPHTSEISGRMLLDAERYYGIPALAMLTVMGAETSMGDPHLGGGLVGVHNYGCLRAYGDWAKTKWGKLANGTVWLAGKNWLAFATPTIGVYAMGRLMKVGPRHKPSFYRDCLTAEPVNWERFADVWYGQDVPGKAAYVADLHKIEDRLVERAGKAGYSW